MINERGNSCLIIMLLLIITAWEHNPEIELKNSGSLQTDEIEWGAMTHHTFFSSPIAGDETPEHSLHPDYFIRFEEQRSILSKISYVNQNRLGEVLLWELSGGFLPNETHKDPFLQVGKTHLKK